MLPKRILSGITAILLTVLASCGFFNDDSSNTDGNTVVTPRFAYVANFNSATIGAFTINASNGSLTQVAGSPVTVSAGPSALGTDAAGNFLYVTSQFTGLLGFVINRNDGTIQPVGPAIVESLTPIAVAVDPKARFVYVANKTTSNVSGFTIGGGGVLTAFSGFAVAVGTNPHRLIVDPSGRFLYVATDTGTWVFTISTDGSLVFVNSVPPNGSSSTPRAVAVDPTSRFAYIANGSTSGGGIDAYAINASNGNLMLIPGSPIPAGSTPVDVAVDPTGKFLYAVNQDSNNISGYTIRTDGTLAAVSGSPFATGINPVSLNIDPSGHFVYVANFNSNSVSILRIGSGGALSNSGSVTIGNNPASVVTTK